MNSAATPKSSYIAAVPGGGSSSRPSPDSFDKERRDQALIRRCQRLLQSERASERRDGKRLSDLLYEQINVLVSAKDKPVHRVKAGVK